MRDGDDRSRATASSALDGGPEVGDQIGPYRLVRLLGAGAAGRVFEVEHERLGRRAAMKTLAAEHAAHPGAIRRLFTEAMAVNRINNPHIVEVTDLVENGEHRRGPAGPSSAAAASVNAIVMELLDGQSLAQAMLREGPLDPERFLPVLAQVSRALAAAHAVGFVHRDLKPDNIFLVDRGRDEDYVKLLDFGVTKALGVESSPTDTPPSSTVDGVFVGTPAYVSPEQASGQSVDHRSDIYAVGIILFELICGRLPFEGPSTAEFLVQHVTEPAPHLPPEVRATTLGAMLDAIIQRCLEKNPAARFPSAAPLARMFDDLAQGGEIAFSGIGLYLAARRTIPEPARGEIARGAIGVGIGVLLALGAGATWAHLRGPAAAHRTAATVAPRPGWAASLAPALAHPQPPPAPEAAAVSQVTLAFESDPPGAEVFVAGRPERLGITPFRYYVARSPEVVSFELRVPGHTPMRVPTPLTSSRSINVTLTGEPVEPRRATVHSSR